MSYSDLQMFLATQIAYLDVNPQAMRGGQLTVRELIGLSEQSDDKGTQDTLERIHHFLNENTQLNESLNWVIKDVRNDQHSTGMYACVIETGKDNAIVAFRGSESDSTDQVVKDWAESDFGLLNSTLTPQQWSAQNYMKDIYQKYGNRYQSFALTGHSLGGNLAEHAAITASDNMKKKIDQCINMDGPGFSAKYLDLHKTDISKSQNLISHYQWSWVGGLLTPISNGKYKTIEADTPDGNLLWRHDTVNVRFDESGNTIKTNERDILSIISNPLSKTLDLSLFQFERQVFGPLAPFIPKLDELSRETYYRMEQLSDKFREGWQQWQNKRWTDTQTNSYIVNARIVGQQLEENRYAVNSISDLADHIHRISFELQTGFLTTDVLRYKLNRLSNGVENYVGKMKNWNEKGLECMQYYLGVEKSTSYEMV